MAESLAITLHAMADEAAGGQSAEVDIGERRSAASLTLEVLAASSSALVVTLETSDTAAAPWRSAGVFPVQNLPGRTTLHFAGLLQFIRISWTLSANAEFSVAGKVHTLWATPEQIAAAPDVLSGLSGFVKAKAAISASSIAEGYLSGAYTLPIVAWDDDLTRNVGLIAAWHLVHERGIRADGADELVLTERDNAIRWLKDIKRGTVRPVGIVDSTPTTSEVGARVKSRSGGSLRGW